MSYFFLRTWLFLSLYRTYKTADRAHNANHKERESAALNTKECG